MDRNSIRLYRVPVYRVSPSSRRAWIEISASILHGTHAAVALLAEGVDRNLLCFTDRLPQLHVALLAEGVDRNWLTAFGAALLIWSPSSRRAWIEIFGHFGPVAAILVSPSSRRAWIEICSTTRHPLPSWSPSSRRAWIEICSSSLRCRCSRSPSSRRAWIEIGHVLAVVNGDWLVALLAEGVDRNRSSSTRLPSWAGRPPRGGRG